MFDCFFCLTVYLLITLGLGDANADGIVNNKDAALIHRYCTGKAPDAFDENTILAADVDGDGNVFTRDASQILQHLEGIKTALSV